MFMTVIIFVVVFAIALHKRQKKLRREQKRRQTRNHINLPEQIQFHYNEARRLEALLATQQTQIPVQYYQYPAYPHVEFAQYS
jgi:hypothetical protein